MQKIKFNNVELVKIVQMNKNISYILRKYKSFSVKLIPILRYKLYLHIANSGAFIIHLKSFNIKCHTIDQIDQCL